MSTRRPRIARALAILGLFAAALTLAACGGSGSASDPGASAADSALKFSKCMREHGVKGFPDPETGPGGGQTLKFKGEGVNRTTMEAAQKACQHFQEEGGEQVELSPQQRVEAEENVQKFARCMREHGIKVKTQIGGGNIAVQIGGPGPGAHGPNPRSPAFQAAQEACRGLLPGPKGKGGPGSAPGPVRAPGGGTFGAQTRAGG